MRNYSIVHLNSVKSGSHSHEVHKEGCRDLAKAANHENVRAMSTNSLIEEQIKGFEADGIEGTTEKDFKVMPCVQ